MISNPLTVRAGADVVEAGRLYVLTRDAYLSAPQATRAKLDALEDLRHVVGGHLTRAGRPVDLTSIAGVRLVETLRQELRRLARGISVHDRTLLLIEILTSAAPGARLPWAAARVTLGVDLAGHLAPEVSPGVVEHLLRRRATVLRGLQASAGRGRAGAPAATVPAEPAWVAETLGSVFGLDPAAAAVAAVRALDAPGGASGALAGGTPAGASATPTTPRGIAGGALFEPVAGVPASGPRAFVGGVLADTFRDAFLGHLATLDVVAHGRADLKAPVAAALAGLRADLVADDTRPVRGAVRALDIVAQRLDGRRRIGRLGGLGGLGDHGVAAWPRPGLHLP